MKLITAIIRPEKLNATIETLIAAARTGEVGDGKIFVVPVEKAVRIRTGEVDVAAVTPALAVAG